MTMMTILIIRVARPSIDWEPCFLCLSMLVPTHSLLPRTRNLLDGSWAGHGLEQKVD